MKKVDDYRSFAKAAVDVAAKTYQAWKGQGVVAVLPALFIPMLVLNLLSLLVLFPPCMFAVLNPLLTTLGVVTSDVRMVNDRGYAPSARPFAPRVLYKLVIDLEAPTQVMDLTVSAWDLGTTTVYLPGLAIDCLLGVVQGVILGTDLLRRANQRGKNGCSSMLPGINMFLYAGMCASALPLHSLGDVPAFSLHSDATSSTNYGDLLLWMDIFCTSLVAPIMLLDGVMYSRYVKQQCPHLCHQIGRSKWTIVGAIGVINGSLTWVAVAHQSTWGPWLAVALHVCGMPCYGIPFCALLVLDCLADARTGHIRPCSAHALFWALASVASLLFFSAGSVLFGTFLARVTGGAFDLMTGVFLGCRIGMVQYWAYARTREDPKNM